MRLVAALSFVVFACLHQPCLGQQTTLAEAKKSFTTVIVQEEPQAGAPETPATASLKVVEYPSPVGNLPAYLTPDPGDGGKHPAIVWITGGDTNSIGDVWTRQPRENDQTARAFRDAGIITMYPSQRGGNNNPGKREGFYGEVDDILAATDYLVKLPYVDPDRVYLGGHSTGGTLAMLVGESTNRYKAVFAFGPVAGIQQYGGLFLYCDPSNKTELKLRSPIYWLADVERPMYVFEGAIDGNWPAIRGMAAINKNPNIHFHKVPDHDHFSLLAPLTERLAKHIVADNLSIDETILHGLK